MRVLITNDDGIDSGGILALSKALGNVAEVDVIAPDRNWSISGHNRTFDRPMRVVERTLGDGRKAYTTDGSPSDCVALALLGLLDHVPELVVSGINKGPNLGDDITYSGTVAAAMEAVLAGIPAIAVSMDAASDWQFDVAAAFVQTLVDESSRHRLESDILLNVNVPNLPREQIAGVEITHLGRRIYRDQLVRRVDPRGVPYYWIGGELPTAHLEEGTDVNAVANGRISVTPIHLDLTNHKLLDKLRGWDLRF